MIFGMMKDNDLKYFAFEFYISIFDGLKVIRVQKYQKNPKKMNFWGSLFWCLRDHRIFIFGIVKELDPNFNDIKLQTPNFIGSKVIGFQKKKKNTKKGFFGGPFF